MTAAFSVWARTGIEKSKTKTGQRNLMARLSPSGQVSDRVMMCLELVLAQVPKSGAGAPGIGAISRGQKPGVVNLKFVEEQLQILYLRLPQKTRQTAFRMTVDLLREL